MAAKTFLQLCKFVAAKSGTITGDLPLTVVGQTSRLKKVVDNTALGWRTIQTLHNNWLWMRKDWANALTIGNTQYNGVSTFSLTDFARWVTEPGTLIINDPAIGAADDGELKKITWGEFRDRYLRGAQTAARPSEYAISPAGELRVGVKPDKAYAIRGEYYTSVQDLAADGTFPFLPADYHDIIGWRGLMLLAEDDEATVQSGTATTEYARLMSALESTQLPQICVAEEPLA